ncbi:MAG: MFS transporter [Anaerolineaceae bacterium]|nr:MFS transporter [Anaerolineaceae bacterium]
MVVHSEADPNHARQSVRQLYALQVLSYSGNALSKPYVNLYVVASGISASVLGVLLSIGALVEMLLPLLLNSLADRHRRHRLLYDVFLSGLVLGNILLASFNQILALGLGVILIEGMMRPSMTLGLQLVITRMSHEGRPIVGRVRSFSSLGFGLASLLANRLFTLGGYFALFTSATIAYASSILLSGALPGATTQARPKSPPRRVPRTRAFYILLVSMFFIMMAQRIGYAFWFLHFQQNLGASTAEIAVIAALMALLEIPFFNMLDRILVASNLYQWFWISGVGMALLWVIVGFLPDKSWIYPLMIFRAFMYAVSHLTTFLVIARVSQAENVATNQALAQGTIPSIATLLTASASGWIYEFVGAQTLFTIISVIGLLGMAISYVALRNVQPQD